MPFVIPVEFKAKSLSYTDCPRKETPDFIDPMLVYFFGGNLDKDPYADVSHVTKLEGVAHAEPIGHRFWEVEPAGQ